jgi:hypothetical protein
MISSGASLSARLVGRKKLGEGAAKSYGRIRKLCPEDVEALEKRLRTAYGYG